MLPSRRKEHYPQRREDYGGKITIGSGAAVRELSVAVEMSGGGTVTTSFMSWPGATGERLRESFRIKDVFDQRGKLTRVFALDPDEPEMDGRKAALTS